MDNDATQKAPTIRDWLAKRQRWRIMPSDLDQAAREVHDTVLPSTRKIVACSATAEATNSDATLGLAMRIQATRRVAGLLFLAAALTLLVLDIASAKPILVACAADRPQGEV